MLRAVRKQQLSILTTSALNFVLAATVFSDPNVGHGCKLICSMCRYDVGYIQKNRAVPGWEKLFTKQL